MDTKTAATTSTTSVVDSSKQDIRFELPVEYRPMWGGRAIVLKADGRHQVIRAHYDDYPLEEPTPFGGTSLWTKEDNVLAFIDVFSVVAEFFQQRDKLIVTGGTLRDGLVRLYATRFPSNFVFAHYNGDRAAKGRRFDFKCPQFQTYGELFDVIYQKSPAATPYYHTDTSDRGIRVLVNPLLPTDKYLFAAGPC